MNFLTLLRDAAIFLFFGSSLVDGFIGKIILLLAPFESVL
jgi:hypothetical protein